MALKREIKDAYIEGGASIYVKTHGDAVYVDDNETETLTQRLDNVKDSIAEHTSQLNENTQDLNSHKADLITDNDGVHGLKVETGTWTPALSVFSGTVSDVIYTEQSGSYYLVGKKVHIRGKIKVSQKGTATGSNLTVTIRGLPFQVDYNREQRCVLPCFSNCIDGIVYGKPEPGDSHILISNTNTTNIFFGDLKTTFEIMFSGEFIIK